VGKGSRQTRSGTRARTARVLVIGVSADAGSELAKGLRCEIVAVPRGEAGIALVAAGQGFDMILCEAILPGLGGAEVLSWLEANKPAQARRLVFMMDSIECALVERLLRGVPNLCLERPFDLEGLRSFIERRVLQHPSRTA
jgi:CheY-like chemotaxis protein